MSSEYTCDRCQEQLTTSSTYACDQCGGEYCLECFAPLGNFPADIIHRPGVRETVAKKRHEDNRGQMCGYCFYGVGIDGTIQ